MPLFKILHQIKKINKKINKKKAITPNLLKQKSCPIKRKKKSKELTKIIITA